MKVRVYVDAVDRTAILFETDWRIEQNLGAALDSVSLSLDDRENAITVLRGEEVIVEDFDDNTVRFFGGIVTEVDMVTRGGLGRRIEVRAEDWTLLLEMSTVQERFFSKTAKQILTTAFDAQHANLTDFDVAALVDDGRVEAFMQPDEMPLREIIDLLAESNNLIWYVTPDKEVVFKPRNFAASGMAFSDAADGSGLHYTAILQALPAGALLNRVVVMGGLVPLFDADTTAIIAGDGQNKNFDIGLWDPAEGEDFIVVERNTGSAGSPVWTAQDVGTLGIDKLTGDGGDKDVLYSPNAGALDWDTAPPDFANGFRVTGRRLAEVKHEEFNAESIAALGRTFTKVIKDRTIRDAQQAVTRAHAELNKASVAERIQFATAEDGMGVGQTFTITNTPLGLSGEYVCTKLITRLLGGTVARYEITGEAIENTPAEWQVVA